MKAAVCYEFGKPLVVEDVDIEKPKIREVKVRLTAAAICHSDIHLIKGEWRGRTPIVAGHEAAGIVEDIGEGVSLVLPGEKVVISLLRSCEKCFYCINGLTHLCEGEFILEKESRVYNKKGKSIYQGLRVGAFAEYVIVDQSQVVKIPDTIPLDYAALLGCCVITGFGAVVNTATVTPGSSVAVIGIGGIGLNVIQGAVFAGAFPIIAIDILENKLNLAKEFGATHTINAGSQDEVYKSIMEITPHLGVDYAFVTVGKSQAISLGLNILSKQGAVIMVGIPDINEPISIPALPFVYKEKKILGSFMGSSILKRDILRLIKLYQEGKLKLSELITSRYSLEHINDAIESVERGEAIRNVIIFS